MARVSNLGVPWQLARWLPRPRFPGPGVLQCLLWPQCLPGALHTALETASQAMSRRSVASGQHPGLTSRLPGFYHTQWTCCCAQHRGNHGVLKLPQRCGPLIWPTVRPGYLLFCFYPPGGLRVQQTKLSSRKRTKAECTCKPFQTYWRHADVPNRCLTQVPF